MISIPEEQLELIYSILSSLHNDEKICLSKDIILKLQEDISKLIFDNAIRNLPLGPFSGAPHTELQNKEKDKLEISFYGDE